MRCIACGWIFNPAAIKYRPDDPAAARMKLHGECWYCATGIPFRNGSPPAVQPASGTPAETTCSSTSLATGRDATLAGPDREGARLRRNERQGKR